MFVSDIMTKSVLSVNADSPVLEVAQLLHEKHLTGLPVVNGDNVVLGTISERDFITESSELYLPTYIKLLSQMDFVQGSGKDLPFALKRLLSATAKDIMNTKIVFAKADTTLDDLAVIFAEKRQNPVPVVDNENKLIGIVSRSDLMAFLTSKKIGGNKEIETRERRQIDYEAVYVLNSFSKRFALVAKARANVWLTAAIVLLIVGFAAGIFYVADPNIFEKEKGTVPVQKNSSPYKNFPLPSNVNQNAK